MWAVGLGLETEHFAKGPFQNLKPRGHWPEPSLVCEVAGPPLREGKGRKMKNKRPLSLSGPTVCRKNSAVGCFLMKLE